MLLDLPNINGYKSVNTSDKQNHFESFNVGSSRGTNEAIQLRRYKLIKNKICGAVLLCIFGVVLTSVGFYWMTIDRKGYVAFLLLGLLSLIPGAYGAYEVVIYIIIYLYE